MSQVAHDEDRNSVSSIHIIIGIYLSRCNAAISAKEPGGLVLPRRQGRARFPPMADLEQSISSSYRELFTVQVMS